jgi:two-component system response regulator GlrR
MSHELYLIEPTAASSQLSLGRMLRSEDGYHCICRMWSSFSAAELNSFDSQLLIAVAVPENAGAVSFFESAHRRPLRVPTLAVVPGEPSEDLLHAVAQAADDFMFWPVREQELHQRVKRLLGIARPDLEAAKRQLTTEQGLAQLVGSASAFREVLAHLARMGPSDAPVLLSGETGTGKEVCARAIHLLSRRRHGPFIPVDCGAIPEHLAESELFGHTRGAFTDAHRDHKGLVSLAAGGTLFLDEIDALSLAMQAKFLRFIQESTYRAVGGEQFCRVDVRVVAATNRSLEQAVHDRQFRNDLYFRLNVLRVTLPPLRERRSDIEILARHCLAKMGVGKESTANCLSHAALRRLEAYDWPGNVRELFNVMQRAKVLAGEAQILPCHIVFCACDAPAPEGPASTFRSARSEAVAAFERRYVQDILEKHNGNITHAARAAGQDRRAFGRLAKKYRLAG